MVLGLFLRGLLVIFRNRKTPRFDACQKIAVRSWLNRNGVLNLELFNFAPDKTSRWQIVGPPRTLLRGGSRFSRADSLALKSFYTCLYIPEKMSRYSQRS